MVSRAVTDLTRPEHPDVHNSAFALETIVSNPATEPWLVDRAVAAVTQAYPNTSGPEAERLIDVAVAAALHPHVAPRTVDRLAVLAHDRVTDALAANPVVPERAVAFSALAAL